MSNVTENRIVRMIFDNASFKRAAAETKGALDHVNKAITNTARNSGLLALGDNMDAVAVKASKAQVAIGAAVGTIASKATVAATGMINSLTFNPIKEGFLEYEALLTKQNTIMNSTGKSATEVKKVLNNLNTYSDKTIFSFSDMTSAITKFTNAGVPLNKAAKSIQGIANAAAFAGLGSEEAGRAFYAFSQSMSTGYLMLQDWNQLDNAGFGNMRFKQEVIDAAEAMGKLTKSGNKWVTDSGKVVTAKNFRNTLQEQWATTEVLNKALNKYADTTTKLGKKAFESATEVRTFSAFLGTLKEGLASGWAQIFTALFGGLEEATKNWTALSNAVGGVVSGFFSWTTSALETWRTMGGFTKFIQIFRNILSPIGAIFKAIGDAWKAAFPNSGKGAGGTLYFITAAIEALTRPLYWLSKLIGLLVHPLTLFFKIIRLGGVAIGKVFGVIKDFANLIWDVATFDAPDLGGFWGFIQKVGRWARDAAREVKELYDKIAPLVDKVREFDFSFDFKMPEIKVPKLPDLHGLPTIGGVNLGGIFGGGADKVNSGVDTVNTSVMSLAGNVKDLTKNTTDLADTVMFGKDQAVLHGSADTMERLALAAEETNSVMSILRDVGSAIATIFEKIGQFIGWSARKIEEFFANITKEDVVKSLNFAVIGTMGFLAAKMLFNFSQILDNFADIGKGAANALNGVGDALGSFQTMARAKLILNIAIAIGILAASLWVLSRIPQEELNKALKAMGGLMAMFGAVLFIFGKAIGMLGPVNVAKIYGMGFAMMAVAVAMLILAGAMLLMKKVGLREMAMTIGLLFYLFLEIALIGKLAGQAGRKMVAASIAMIGIGIALGILAGSIMLFKFIKPSDMVKAGLALLALTAIVVLFSFVPAGILVGIGIAFLALAGSVLILASALIVFAAVKWTSILKASAILLVFTAAIVAITIFGGGPAGASAIIALAAGVMILALAMLVFNKVSWPAVAKGAAVLLILIAAFALFMGVVYLASPVIPLLTGLALGLAALAGAIALLILAFSVGLPLMAAGTAAFAAFAIGAAVAIAAFLQTLAAEAPTMKKAGIEILQVFCDGIVESVPIILDTMKRVLKAIWDFFAGPQTTETGEKGGDSILNSFRKKLEEWTPKILQAIEDLIKALARKIEENGDNIIAALIDILISILNGIAGKADDFSAAAANLIIKFMEGLGKQAQPLAEAGIQLIVDLVNGIANAINNKGGELGTAITNAIAAMSGLGSDLVEGLSVGIGAAARDVATSPWTMIKGVVKGVVHGAEEEADAHSPSRKMIRLGEFMTQGLAIGVQNYAAAAIRAIASVVSGQIATASSYISKYVQKLDQKSIAAQARAEGLAAAAQRASEAAQASEKNKKDDKSAEKLQEQADAAAEASEKAQERAQKAKDAADRRDIYVKATTLEKAKMRSEDAQRQIDEAKEAELDAARSLAQARALQKQVATKKFTKAESVAMRKEIEELRKEAEASAKLANSLIAKAKASTADALRLQKLAGAQAAAAFQKQFEAEAKADADAAKFEAMTDEQKAARRRQQAAALQKKANEDLAAAKKLAYTDLEAANELAQRAMEQADLARDYLKEAADYEKAAAEAKAQAAADAAAKAEEERKKAEEDAKYVRPVNIPLEGTTSVDVTASDAAALAFQNYADMYSTATAAAAASQTIEFKQYNTSPEALSPTEIYRQTNNLLTQASSKIGKAA